VSDFQKKREEMTALRRATERRNSQKAVDNVGSYFNNAAELQKRINPVSLPAQMMANPAIQRA